MPSSPEIFFKNGFLKSFGTWHTKVEPGIGSDVGAADVFMLDREPSPWCRSIIPVEFKIGEFRPDHGGGAIFCRPVRPAQMEWHRKFAETGLHSFFMIGIETPADGIVPFCISPSALGLDPSFLNKPFSPNLGRIFDNKKDTLWGVHRISVLTKDRIDATNLMRHDIVDGATPVLPNIGE
jgi:hypothetical protein